MISALPSSIAKRLVTPDAWISAVHQPQVPASSAQELLGRIWRVCAAALPKSTQNRLAITMSSLTKPTAALSPKMRRRQ